MEARRLFRSGIKSCEWRRQVTIYVFVWGSRDGPQLSDFINGLITKVPLEGNAKGLEPPLRVTYITFEPRRVRRKRIS